MKRILLIPLCFLLSGCMFSKEKPVEIEPKANITVCMDDEAYAKALQSLWEEEHPHQKDALQFRKKQEGFHQQFYADIEWVSDMDAVYKKSYAKKMEMSYDTLKEEQLREALDSYFLPIEGKGLLFSYVSKESKSWDQFPSQGYYYHHQVEQVLPLVIKEEKEDVSMNDVFLDDTTLQEIKAWKKQYQNLHLEDDPYHAQDPFSYGYTSALVDVTSIVSNPRYQTMELHFSTMPSSYVPFVTTYGFMVSKNCNYPNCAQAFLDMVRSEKGLQAYLDASQGVLLLQQENIAQFHIYDTLRKEMMIAMNHSQLWDFHCIKEKPSITYYDLYHNTDYISILQNGVVSNQSAKLIQRNLHENAVKWIKNQ